MDGVLPRELTKQFLRGKRSSSISTKLRAKYAVARQRADTLECKLAILDKHRFAGHADRLIFRRRTKPMRQIGGHSTAL